MKENREISIVEEMNREAEEILREIEADESLRDVEFPPELDARIKERIAEIEAETERKNAAYGNAATGKSSRGKVRRMPRKKKIWIALVAVLILLLAIGTTSVGSKSYLKQMWDKSFGNNDVDVVSVADMESSELKELDDATIYREIREKLGIEAVQLGSLPYGMKLDSYEIDVDAEMAKLFFLYHGETVQYKIYANDNDSSYGKHPADKMIDSFEIENSKQKINVEEYQVEGKEQNCYYAEFDYMDVKYQLVGVLERANFEEILKNLKYF